MCADPYKPLSYEIKISFLSLDSPKHPSLSVKCAVPVIDLEAHDSIKAKHVFQN